MAAVHFADPTTQSARRIAARDLRSDFDLSSQELVSLLDLAGRVKHAPKRFDQSLKGQYLSLLFEKPSLRTRLTFELAIKQLGGDAVTSIGTIGEREPLKDMARNLDRWTQCIVARTFLQQTIDELAAWSSVPVVNALSDMYHPCQALADMLTLRERYGNLTGRKLAFVGDGNNVAHSLMLCAARLGMDFALAHPEGYAADPATIQKAREFGRATGASISITTDPAAAVRGADAVYADVWTSMGQEEQKRKRLADFSGYQINRGSPV